VLDELMIRSLHVQALKRDELHAEREPHILFQASTIAALLDGAYEGDVSFEELARHGDLGLGTLNGLDGEMIAVDGRFYRADVDGAITEVPGSQGTPFAVVIRFAPTLELELPSALGHDALLRRIESRLPPGTVACAIRLDGDFEHLRLRSVPKQEPPYRPLEEVVAEQHVFELSGVAGTLVGFRFPDYSEGIEVPGYHLHFISAERSRGGHLLEAKLSSGRAAIDLSAELRVELPAGVDLAARDLSRDAHEALEAAEHSG
jgi:acetolactate decarboxylase